MQREVTTLISATLTQEHDSLTSDQPESSSSMYGGSLTCSLT